MKTEMYIHVRYNWNLYTEVSDGFNYKGNQTYKTRNLLFLTLETFRETYKDG